MKNSADKLSAQQKALLAGWKKGKFAQRAEQSVPKRDHTQPDFPVSYAQRQLWVIDKLVRDSPSYNMPAALRLTGTLNVVALEKTLNEIIHRHEILRTAFPAINEEPRQVIATAFTLPLPLFDLTELSSASQAHELDERMEAEAVRPFDLDNGPLMRAHLLKMQQHEHILLLTLHHIISDSWSIAIFLRELGTLYDDFCKNRPISLPVPQIHYADYASWEQGWLKSKEMQEQLRYWQKQLENAPPVLDLPTDFPRPSIQSFRGDTYRFTLPQPLYERLKSFSQQESVTLFITLMTTFQLLLWRYTLQDEILVGTPTGHRPKKAFEAVMGPFFNPVILRTKLNAQISFRDLLQQVQATSLAAFSRVNLPFEKLVDVMQPARDMSHNPLFQVMFILQNAPAPEIKLADIKIESIETGSGTAKFDIWLSMEEANGQLAGIVEYMSDLFAPDTIQRLIKHFEQLLEAAVADADRPIADLPILDSAEIAQIVTDWNATQTAYTRQGHIHQQIEAQVEKTPQAIALTFEGQSLTYAALNRRANRLAHHLRTLGVGPDVYVGVCLERSLEMVISLLAILKAGGAYVPIDPEYPQDRIQFMLADAQASVLLTEQQWLPLLDQTRYAVFCLDAGYEEQIAHLPATNPNVALLPTNLAYMIYTSGSTGRPKGAMNTHEAIRNRLLWMQSAYQLNATDCVLQKTPFSFDVSVWEFFWPLMYGARLAVAKPGGHRDSGYLVRLIAEQQVTTLHFVPSMLNAFLEDPDLSLCGSMRRVICSGEALPHALMTSFFAQFDCELHNLYGPTEAAIDVTFWPCEIDYDSLAVPIGAPIANTQIYILDTQMRPVPIGVKGELYIGGIGLARGYHNRPALTAEKFVPNPFAAETASRLYRTGDLARFLPNGQIEYVGRVDFQVKLRGFRIEMGEIENTLRQHPSLADAAVTIHQDAVQSKQLAGYLVPTTDLFDSFQDGDKTIGEAQVADWEQVFDSTYQETPTAQSPIFNINGWNDSYTGEAIPAANMQTWVDDTVAQVLKHQPQRVLEIGCGTGLLLFRIAPHCETYWGTDIASNGLAYIQAQIDAGVFDGSNVMLSQQAAHDFANLPEQTFDMIVINSVAQYFPSVDYLLNVLQQAVARLRPGGHIYLGDIRDLSLLTMFHASVEIQRMPESLHHSHFRRWVETRARQETELVIDPTFFFALPDTIPQISHAVVQLKRGRYTNELSKYRYEVCLHVGEPQPDDRTAESLVWGDQIGSLAELEAVLTTAQPDLLGIHQIPNARLGADARVWRWMNGANGDETVADFQFAQSRPFTEAVQPADLWQWAEQLGYEAIVSPSQTPTQRDRFDLLLWRQGEPEPRLNLSDVNQASAPDTLTNNPLLGKLSNFLTSSVHDYLKERLPDYMIPTAYTVLDKMPLMPNGKLNRRALPEPDFAIPTLEQTFEAPRTPLEQRLVNIWAQVLGLNNIGVTNNFFELGGDSIQGIQVINRANRQGMNLTPTHLFQNQTIAELAKVAMREQAANADGPSQQHRTKPFSLIENRAEVEKLIDGRFEIEDAYPLAPMPKYMLKHYVASDAAKPAMWQRIFPWEGPLDIEALQQAYQDQVDRHPAFRTSIIWEGVAEPLQLIHKTVPVCIPVYDWQNLSAHHQETALQAFLTADLQRGFDIAEPYPWRLTVLQLGAETFRIIESCHYLRMDGWSLTALTQEMFMLYDAHRRQKTVELGPLPRPYRDYVAWINEKQLDSTKSFWQEKLKSFTAPTPLLANAPENETGGEDKLNQGYTYLSQAFSKEVADFARAHKITENTLVQAAWALVLAHYTQQENVVFGIVVAGRTTEVDGIEEMIGPCANSLPLPVNLSSDQQLLPWLAELRALQVEISNHEHTPVQKIHEWLSIPSKAKLFESILIFQNLPRVVLEREQVTDTPLYLTSHLFYAQYGYPLRLDAFPGVQTCLIMSYNHSDFTARSVRRMLTDLEQALRAIVQNPHKTLRDVKQRLGSKERV